MTGECTPRVLVVHSGARHGYALPAALADAGMLEAFYTDLCAGRGVGRALQALAELPLPGPVRARAARIAARRPPADVLARTRTAGLAALGYEIARAGAPDGNAAFRALYAHGRRKGRIMRRWGLRGATHLFRVQNEGGDLVRAAREEGIAILSDVIIAPSSDRIVRAEHAAFPEWGPPPPDPSRAIGRDFRAEAFFLETTDVFVCPSPFVADDLVRNWGVDRGRITIVPYAVSPSWFALEPSPTPGRILFAGSAERRKGIHYLAEACRILRGRGHRYDVKVAGNVCDTVLSRPETRGISFLGRVPRTRVQEEFARADVFVLPTLAEGSATATYEALAAGLPVITTRAAGSVARDGVDGIIVPERDPQALAEAIETLVEDRAMRARMSRNARRRAASFNLDVYGAAIRSVVLRTRSRMPGDADCARIDRSSIDLWSYDRGFQLQRESGNDAKAQL